MYRTASSNSRDHRYTRSPPRSNRYNSVLDDDTISIELGRTVPQHSNMGRGYKDTETLSEKDYFKMDDLFRKDRDEFLKRNDVDDDATQRFRENTFKIIEELPSNVASKYGEVLTDLTNKFIQEHLALRARYNELLKSKTTDTSPGRREKEQGFLIEKLTEKLKRYKGLCSEYQLELNNKDEIISKFRSELKTVKAAGLQEVAQSLNKMNYATTETDEKEEDWSSLINELKTGMSKIELEEEMRIKKELQQKEYKLLRQQLEDLQNERNRKTKQVLNRDLDQFKLDLKSEIGELFKGLHLDSQSNGVAPTERAVGNEATKQESRDNELFDRLKELIQSELKLNNEQMREKFEKLLQNKVDRDELEELLFRSNGSREEKLKKTLSIFNSVPVPNECKYCSNSDLKRHKRSLKTEIEDLNEKLRLLTNEISRLENNQELDETEMMRLISERHSVRQELKEKKYEMENFIFDDQENEDATGEQPQESDNCRTINILRDNALKFGISLKKNGVC